MKLRSGKIVNNNVTTKNLPSNILKEIDDSITKLKNIILFSNRFEKDFGPKMLELLFVIGQDKGVFINDVYKLITDKYPLQEGRILFTEEECNELSTLECIIYNLTHFIVGDHKKLLETKEYVRRKNVEKAIISSFYKTDIDLETKDEMQNSSFNNTDSDFFEPDNVNLIGND